MTVSWIMVAWFRLFRTATYLEQYISASYEGLIRSVVIVYTAERGPLDYSLCFLSDVLVVIYAGIIYQIGYFVHR